MVTAGGGPRSGGSGRGPGGRGVWIGAVLIAAALGLVVFLSGRQSGGRPFDVASSGPDGYRAIAILLRDRGSDVLASTADRMRREPPGPGEVLVVPVPEMLTTVEYRSVLDAARGGALVVLGGQRPVDDRDPAGGSGTATDPSGGWTGAVSARSLADMPAQPTRPDICDITRVTGLGAIDSLTAEPIGVRGSREERSCYGDGSTAYVTEEHIGQGSVVTLGSPYMWANARLQPDKEDGGEPLDNAALALRLLGPTADGATTGTRITFVDAVPTAGVSPNGTRNPVELLPTGVKLALVQLLAAFVIYAWFRARRLGPVVTERMPVQIAGSELVAAVGDLLRRKGTPQRAADVLRHDSRRELARRLGVAPDVAPATLVSVVASRTGVDPDRVAAALADGPVVSAEALVRLAEALTDIRQEVLSTHVRSTRA